MVGSHVTPFCTRSKALHNPSRVSPQELANCYLRLKRLASRDLRQAAISTLIGEMAVGGLDLLVAECDRVPLVSNVAGKTYFAFRRGERISRPINIDLFVDHPDVLTAALPRFTPDELIQMSAGQSTRLIYSLAMSFCAVMDVTKDRDKQTPATYFAHLIAHVFAITLACHPQTEIDVLAFEGERSTLPTDYIFDLGPGRNKIHLPVKTSTRERVIQAWAHQRVLDGVYGMRAIKGVLVTLTETKLDRTTLVVTEICLPDQWRVYQRFIAEMDRVYYLDAPAPYIALAPRIVVRPLGEMFGERAYLVGGP